MADPDIRQQILSLSNELLAGSLSPERSEEVCARLSTLTARLQAPQYDPGQPRLSEAALAMLDALDKDPILRSISLRQRHQDEDWPLDRVDYVLRGGRHMADPRLSARAHRPRPPSHTPLPRGGVGMPCLHAPRTASPSPRAASPRAVPPARGAPARAPNSNGDGGRASKRPRSDSDAA
eukprot:m.229354 g.229354  ORF g.229354 m.229354 type:complete len:179 (-) comp11893_c0_seq1:90-626(-)